MPLTSTEKSARRDAKKKANGLVRICEWGTEQQKSDIKLYLSGKATIVKGGDNESIN